MPESSGAYFAGEIVHPTSDYVLLYHRDQVVDSAKLDADNRFEFDLDAIKGGLYHFHHDLEYQYVYLEEGDSLLARLNMIAFDESLVFSGNNGDVNNFLIEMFLNHEDEENYVYSLYKLSPDEFQQKIDSLRQQKIEELKSLERDSEVSSNALAMAKASIDYGNFKYKEKYPFYHKKYTNENDIHALGDTFYGHRKLKPDNQEELVYFRPYYDYMKYRFSNLAYTLCRRDCGGFDTADGGYKHLNTHKLHLIDSLVGHEELRNNLLRSTIMDVLLKEHTIDDEAISLIQKFRSLSTNQSHHTEINDLYAGIKNLQPKSSVPKLNLTSYNGNEVSLREITKAKQTVLYFWSGHQKGHLKNVKKRIKKLEAEHPNVQFIGICVMTAKTQWTTMVNENDLDPNNQFWSTNKEELRNKLVVNGLNKCVIINDTVIENGFANIFTSL